MGVPALPTRLLLGTLVVAGCRAPARDVPVEAPVQVAEVEWTADWSQFTGGALEGPRARTELVEIDADPARALALALDVWSVEGPPTTAGAALAPAAELVVVSPNSTPLSAAPELLASGRLARGDEAEALLAGRVGPGAIHGAARRAALLPGTTGFLSVHGSERRPLSDGTTVLPRIGIALTRGADGGDGRVSLVAEGPYRVPRPLASDDEDEVATPVGQRVRRQELVTLEAPLAAGAGPLAFVLPSPFQDGASLVVRAELSPPPGDEPAYPEDRALFAALVERASEDVAAAARGAATRAAGLLVGESEVLAWRRAFEAVLDPDKRRGAIAHLAGSGGASLALDVALVADDALLVEFANHLAADGVAPQVDGTQGGLARLGWFVETSAIKLLAARLGADGLSPELEAVLLRHTGQAGRFPGTLEDAAASSADLASLRARIVEENRIFLEDSSPSARLRAYDWLAVRGAAPEGFDPLAPAEERRAVLAALRAAQASIAR